MPEARDEIIIRKATKNDIGAMMRLISELAYYEKAPDEVTVSEEQFMECGFGKSPVWWAYVAESGNKIVGMALYYIRYSTWKGPKMYLEDLVISKQWRGKGIGMQLFEQLFKAAKERNLNGINWQVLTWNEDAIHFYKKIKGVKFDAEWTNCSIDFIN